ncbi:N-acyl homoserine lactonase family protein [Tengunoibacter tsumagoiensis]|uniref:N-acyl homoserine lactonase n=1 Tax=Tengunoibacter tsumagoiensis TaxID=2014871 RepID=A0A402A053_9CHLR|nr:N-acyl homoserine lactonase family protein [Tengunoibacter tsumagoiensis]GCE12475.1 N-acyl homoserine lactonase [Tengunoibacter tsumagoiensis]
MKLYCMQLATIGENHMPIPGYLIQTDEGQHVLIDTGLPHTIIAGKSIQMGPLQVRIQTVEPIMAQLARINLQPENIDYLICSHFDPDHVGNHELFSHARLIAQRTQYEYALQSPLPRFSQFRGHWDRPTLQYQLIEGDHTLLPGVELIETSGHVSGHQSVLVRLPDAGPILLAIDAITHSDGLDPETRTMSPLDMNEKMLRLSTRKLINIAQREHAKHIICGHDAEQWMRLKKLPEYYT